MCSGFGWLIGCSLTARSYSLPSIHHTDDTSTQNFKSAVVLIVYLTTYLYTPHSPLSRPTIRPTDDTPTSTQRFESALVLYLISIHTSPLIPPIDQRQQMQQTRKLPDSLKCTTAVVARPSIRMYSHTR